MQVSNTWTTFKGKEVSFDTIDHQHLSNCYWFSKIVYDLEDTDIHLINITNKLAERFNGQLLPYRPHIQFATEIGLLNSKGFLRYDNSNPNRVIIHNGNHEIGEIICTPTNRIDLN